MNTFDYPARLDNDFISFFFDKYRPGSVLDPFGGDGAVAFLAKQHGIFPIHADCDEISCIIAETRTYPYSRGMFNHAIVALEEATGVQVGDIFSERAVYGFRPGHDDLRTEVPLEQQEKALTTITGSLAIPRQMKNYLRLLTWQVARRLTGGSLAVGLMEAFLHDIKEMLIFIGKQESQNHKILPKIINTSKERVHQRFDLCICAPPFAATTTDTRNYKRSSPFVPYPSTPKEMYHYFKDIVSLGKHFVFLVSPSNQDVKAKTIKNVMNSLGLTLVDETTCEEKREARTTISATVFVLEFASRR